MRIAIKPAATLLTALLVTTVGAYSAETRATSAKVYKWVDERGVTHFSAIPPEAGKPAETINIRTGEPSGDSSPANPAETVTAPSPPQSEGLPPREAYRQRDQALCDQARETDAALADSDRVQVREQDSEDYRTVDADELEEWRERARADIRRYCQ